MTSDNWSLERIYCQNRGFGSVVAVLQGPNALTRGQVQSSLACAVIGRALILAMLLALIVWFGGSLALFLFLLVVILLCCVPSLRRCVHIFRVVREVLEEEDVVDPPRAEEYAINKAVSQLRESVRVTSPCPALCYVVLVLQVSLFFLCPLAYFFQTENYPLGTLILVMGVFSGMRHFLNSYIVLREVGTMGMLGQERILGINLTPADIRDKGTDQDWKAKSRLAAIIRNITRGRAIEICIWVFVVLLILLFTVVVLGAIVKYASDSAESTERIVFLSDFEYKPKLNLFYPTCQLGKGLTLPNGNNTALVDYVFLGSLAYTDNNNTQIYLNQWFGLDDSIVSNSDSVPRAINNPQIVQDFKDSHKQYGGSPVHYKFLTFPKNPTFGVVMLRGSATGWDFLTDAQLWGAAAFHQMLRALLPLGEVFTPILHKTVSFTAILETNSIQKVSYYKEVSAFVNWIKVSRNYTTVQITGHSLGGGLALISGAQTGTAAVGISAPNSVLSRDTIDPPVTLEALNSLTLNIVPKRDIIPMVDDKADLYQIIECRAAATAFSDCHKRVRSLCEIMYSCGTGPRPAICMCAEEFRYPPPVQIGQRSFEEACPNYNLLG